jgi:predicted GH43/DUF377 family glycosyl hydrolase
MLRSFALFCLLSTYGVLFGQSSVEIRAERLSTQPLLRPSEQGSAQSWYSFGIFNPTAIKRNGKTVLLFRAQDDKHTSRIGYSESADGVHFAVRPDPILSPETDYEKGGGLEDPRVVEINGTYYLTYTGYNLHDAQLCMATSPDLLHWKRVGVILPAYKGTWNQKWTKSGAIVPTKISGKWWMYYLGTRKDSAGKERDYMGLASSNDLLHWQDATKEPVLPQRPGAFDSRVMEPGPAPIVSDNGIILLYNGADDHLVYGPGWVLFDRNDPKRLVARSDHPFVLPKLPWEKVGNVPNVIFLEGAVQNNSNRNLNSNLNLTGYYGAADKYIGALNIAISPGRL